MCPNYVWVQTKGNILILTAACSNRWDLLGSVILKLCMHEWLKSPWVESMQLNLEVPLGIYGIRKAIHIRSLYIMVICKFTLVNCRFQTDLRIGKGLGTSTSTTCCTTSVFFWFHHRIKFSHILYIVYCIVKYDPILEIPLACALSIRAHCISYCRWEAVLISVENGSRSW